MADSYPRGLPRKPSKKQCENGLIDDGKNCLERKACRRVACKENKNGCLKCDVSIVKTKEEDRFYCDQHEEKVGNLCYKICKNGYFPKGSLCVKGIPSDISKKLKQGKIKNKGYIPTVINAIKRNVLRLMGRNVEGFENIEEVSFIDELDIFLKDFLGKDLEKYRWHIFTIVIISIIIIIDFEPEENINTKSKYEYIDKSLLEEFLRDIKNKY